MENQIQEKIKIKNNSSKFVPKKESERYDKETGKYNNQPLDPEYYKMYWKTKNEHVPCEHCGKLVGKLRMCKHIKSQQCQRAQKAQKVDQLLQLEERVFQALEILEKHLRISKISFKSKKTLKDLLLYKIIF